MEKIKMKKIIVSTLLIGSFVFSFAQKNEGQKAFEEYTLINSIIFQNFSLPFYDIKSNFLHPGLEIGLESNLNKRGNLFLDIGLGGYINKEMGNGFYFQSQTIFRPNLFKSVKPSVKLGVGWHRTYHPVQSYEFVAGDWAKTADGKSQLTIPIGIGVEYKKNKLDTSLIPFISYQMVPNLYYNKTIPISFYTFFETGIKVNLK